MIKVNYYYNDDFLLKGFCLKGHADYAEIGYDIVCSAVTSNAVAVINSLDKLQKVEFEKIELWETITDKYDDKITKNAKKKKRTACLNQYVLRCCYWLY